MAEIDQDFDRIAEQVEVEWDLDGLAGGTYGRFAIELAQRYVAAQFSREDVDRLREAGPEQMWAWDLAERIAALLPPDPSSA